MQKLYIAIAILLAVWLIYLLFFTKNPDYRLITKCVSVLITYILAITGIRRRKSRSDALSYQKAYRDIIGDAFQNDKHSLRELVRAIQFFNENKPERALTILDSLEHSCTANADYVAVLMFRALIYSEQRLKNDAIQTYETLLQYDNTHSKAWSNLGMHYTDLNRLEEAEHAYLRAMDCNPWNPCAYANMAALSLKKGLPDKAVKEALHALELDPKLYQAMSAASIGYALLGDKDKAKKYLELYARNGGNRYALETQIKPFIN